MKNHGQSPHYYPISLNIHKKKCVVVGGGKVAFRKVKALLEHGANVEVISSVLCSELTQLAEVGAISVLYKNYEPGDLKDASIAIAATAQSSTNQKVAGEARKQRILVNVVDSPEQSDFIVPSHLRRGDLTIAVSTGGKSPALSRKIRIRLEQNFGEEYASLVTLIEEVRSELKRQGVTVSGDAWQQALDLDLLIKLLRAGQREEAKAHLLRPLKIGDFQR